MPAFRKADAGVERAGSFVFRREINPFSFALKLARQSQHIGGGIALAPSGGQGRHPAYERPAVAFGSRQRAGDRYLVTESHSPAAPVPHPVGYVDVPRRKGRQIVLKAFRQYGIYFAWRKPFGLHGRRL
ncbi:hypothetical protein SDC9_153668 [bioreactor metagenome]|uniref:Uncharacterized protein n=1 Tax=bioreactor metagenome TaxID=1076179 RepID=A0A645EYS7_9ZZZZ